MQNICSRCADLHFTKRGIYEQHNDRKEEGREGGRKKRSGGCISFLLPLSLCLPLLSASSFLSPPLALAVCLCVSRVPSESPSLTLPPNLLPRFAGNSASNAVQSWMQ